MIDPIPLIPTADPDLVAHFARREGGVSESPFDSLNLGFSTGDNRAHVIENRRRFAAAVGVPLQSLVVPGQVHGREVLTVGRELAGEGAESPSGKLRGHDAMVIAEPGVFALALSADCPLVVMVDRERRQLGVAHAGWRGTVAGVVEALAAAMVTRGAQLGAVEVGISPAIGGCCYPVGEEVFAALGDSPGIGDARDGRRLDLRVVLRARTMALGCAPSRIHVSDRCSCCEPESFFSHRRDAERSGRGGCLVGWRAD